VFEPITMEGAASRDDTVCALFRKLNERIIELEGERSEYDLVCECRDDACTRVMHLTADEYTDVRARPDAYAVVAGHEGDSDVLTRTNRYVVVRGRCAAA
jgi:hypothetical protein